VTPSNVHYIGNLFKPCNLSEEKSIATRPDHSRAHLRPASSAHLVRVTWGPLSAGRCTPVAPPPTAPGAAAARLPWRLHWPARRPFPASPGARQGYPHLCAHRLLITDKGLYYF